MSDITKPTRKPRKKADEVIARNAKYELLANDTRTSWDGKTLYRLRAVVAIGLHVAAGDLGGYIEAERNLSVSGDAWVYGNALVSGNAQVYGNALVSGNAWVYGNARVYGNAQVYGNARVYGNAQVYGNALVSGNAQVYGNARVYGNAQVYGNARVYGNAQVYGNALVSGNAQVYGNARVYGNALVSGNAWVYGVNIVATRSDGYTFLVAPTPKGARIIAGCRYFSFEEARTHWTKTRAGTRLGEESLALVDHLERMANLCGFDKPAEVRA